MRLIGSQASALYTSFALFNRKAWVITGAATVAALALSGAPTVMFETPLFVRMTPVRPEDYGIWLVTSVLIGLIAGTFAVARSNRCEGKMASGGVLSVLAIGCPVCNKGVVLLLGTGGALTWFAPVQIYIGIASILLLGWVLLLRARALSDGCVPRTAQPGTLVTPVEMSR